MVGLGGGPRGPYAFGCADVETRLFHDQPANGIIGMSPSSATYVAAMAAGGTLGSPLFALCLGADGGVLSVGEVAAARHYGSTGTVAVTDSARWNVWMDAVGLVEAARGVSRDVLLDTGTTFSYMPRAVLVGIVSSLGDYCTQSMGGRMRCTIPSMPRARMCVCVCVCVCVSVHAPRHAPACLRVGVTCPRAAAACRCVLCGVDRGRGVGVLCLRTRRRAEVGAEFLDGLWEGHGGARDARLLL